MAFKPKRFLNCGRYGEGEAGKFNIKGSKEMKMMLFGLGRRMCPGTGSRCCTWSTLWQTWHGCSSGGWLPARRWTYRRSRSSPQ
ncbi:hypothetical protein NL676_022428 [Syzygium grande]|nr:hypothetical protein NL676_022428 [Syzygium grande]